MIDAPLSESYVAADESSPVLETTVGSILRDADPSAPAADAELHSYCRDHLSPQKTPTVRVRVEEFPLIPSGKIKKFVLREQWERGSAD